MLDLLNFIANLPVIDRLMYAGSDIPYVFESADVILALVLMFICAFGAGFGLGRGTMKGKK